MNENKGVGVTHSRCKATDIDPEDEDLEPDDDLIGDGGTILPV